MNRTYFIIGFFIGVAFFVAANIYSYHVAEPPCCDFSIPFGVPFPLARTGGFIGSTHFIVAGVVIDVMFGLNASVGFGWVFAKALPWITSVFCKGVQWHLRTRSQESARSKLDALASFPFIDSSLPPNTYFERTRR